VEVLPLPVKVGLKKLAARRAAFDLTFLDPPYGGGLAAATLKDLEAARILAPSARVVAEHSRRETLPEVVGSLREYDLRSYGDTRVAFYEVREENSPEQEL
jgi:16S rRNA (guanine966-N2)-methyltransferase